MAAQVALKRQQAAEDAIALGLRCASEGNIPIMTQGPLWGPGTVSPPEKTEAEKNDADDESSDDQGKNSEFLWIFLKRPQYFCQNSYNEGPNCQKILTFDEKLS